MEHVSHLTPAELKHLLDAHTRVYPDPASDWDMSPVGVDTRKRFVEMGMIYIHEDGYYRTTEIGSRWIERILATPDPATWDRMLSEEDQWPT